MKKDKIGIITIVDGMNYGNVLQNYALQYILSQRGFDVETIMRRTYRSVGSMGRLIQTLKIKLKVYLKRKDERPILRRRKNFETFKKRHIIYSKFDIGNNTFPEEFEKEYQYFVFGSDQIWNPNFRIIYEDIDNYFGLFTNDNKKIAYAASFGISEIPDKWKDYYEKNLKTFKAISVREQAGKMIVSDLAGIDVPCVPDPTMLVSADEWRQVACKPTGFDDSMPYVATYFLGGIPENIEKQIDSYAVKNNLRIVCLNNIFDNCKNSEAKQLYANGPGEFLWFIEHCSFLLTDSFHGCVFSIIFGRPFQVFTRHTIEKNNNMESRLTTLLQVYDEGERYGNMDLCEDLIERSLDIEKNEEQLKEYSSIGKSFLDAALKNISD